jgi:hypothetical protein
MVPLVFWSNHFLGKNAFSTTSVTKGLTQKLPKKLRLSKPTDMTIHWKALEEHFLMVPLVFMENAFSEFFSKKSRVKACL